MNTEINLCELLPWYINGTLPSEELKAVSDHLSECSECAAELDKGMCFSQQFQASPKDIAQLEGQFEEGLSLLRQKIVATERPTKKQVHFLYKYTKYLPRFLPQVAIIAATLVIGLSLFNVMTPHDQALFADEEFIVLTQENDSILPVVQIIFEPGTTEREMRNLILDMQASIIENPSQTGVYRLELSRNNTPEELLLKIRSYEQVRWAELETRGAAQ